MTRTWYKLTASIAPVKITYGPYPTPINEQRGDCMTAPYVANGWALTVYRQMEASLITLKVTLFGLPVPFARVDWMFGDYRGSPLPMLKCGTLRADVNGVAVLDLKAIEASANMLVPDGAMFFARATILGIFQWIGLGAQPDGPVLEFRRY